MPSIHDPARRRELVERLARLTPETKARWGRFTAQRMVKHTHDSIRMATGEFAVRPRRLPLLPILRPLIIHVLPFPKGAPTAPELLDGEIATWDADLAALRAAIDSLEPPARGTPQPEHPAFGPMTVHDWGVLLYKHLDHHFRQFGI